MMKKSVCVLTASLLFTGCGLNDPLYQPTGSLRQEEFLGHKIYNGLVYDNCNIYNRETRLSYFAKNRIIFIPELGQFRVVDTTSPFATNLISPQMYGSMKGSDTVVLTGNDRSLNFRAVVQTYGDITEFAVANRNTNKFVIYQCESRTGAESRIISEMMQPYVE